LLYVLLRSGSACSQQLAFHCDLPAGGFVAHRVL
jgi:hypothetical protein